MPKTAATLSKRDAICVEIVLLGNGIHRDPQPARRKPMTRSRIVAFFLIAATVPLFADSGRQHVVIAPTAGTVVIRGVVRDSSGAPVAGAYVRSGAYTSSRNNGTGADGKYSLTVPGGRPLVLTVEDFAFEPVTVTMTPTADSTLDVTLPKARPTVTVKLTSGESHVLDLGTSRFAY